MGLQIVICFGVLLAYFGRTLVRGARAVFKLGDEVRSSEGGSHSTASAAGRMIGCSFRTHQNC